MRLVFSIWMGLLIAAVLVGSAGACATGVLVRPSLSLCTSSLSDAFPFSFSVRSRRCHNPLRMEHCRCNLVVVVYRSRPLHLARVRVRAVLEGERVQRRHGFVAETVDFDCGTDGGLYVFFHSSPYPPLPSLYSTRTDGDCNRHCRRFSRRSRHAVGLQGRRPPRVHLLGALGTAGASLLSPLLHHYRGH